MQVEHHKELNQEIQVLEEVLLVLEHDEVKSMLLPGEYSVERRALMDRINANRAALEAYREAEDRRRLKDFQPRLF